MPNRVSMTEDEVYDLPVIVTYLEAARAHGIGKKLANRLRAEGNLPFPTRPQGRALVVTKHQLLESLNLPTSTSRLDPAAMTSPTVAAEGATPAPLTDDQAEMLAALVRGVARDVENRWIEVTIRLDPNGIQDAAVAACGQILAAFIAAGTPIRPDTLKVPPPARSSRTSLRPN